MQVSITMEGEVGEIEAGIIVTDKFIDCNPPAQWPSDFVYSLRERAAWSMQPYAHLD